MGTKTLLHQGPSSVQGWQTSGQHADLGSLVRITDIGRNFAEMQLQLIFSVC